MLVSHSRSRVLALALVLLSSNTLIEDSFSYCDAKPFNLDDQIFEVTRKYKGCLDLSKLTVRKTYKDGMKVYRCSIRDNEGFLRIGQIDVAADIQVAVEMWEDHIKRSTWDSSVVSETQVIDKIDENVKVNYLINRAKYLPSRDFALVSTRSGAAMVDNNSFKAVVLVNTDASDLIPRSWKAIRGKMEGVVLFEPIGFRKTRVTYVVNVFPSGWSSVMPYLADILMGDNVLMTLSNLKTKIENDRSFEDDLSIPVEEVVRRQQARKKKEQQDLEKKYNFLDDMSLSESDMISTVSMLEERLKKLEKSEKEDKIDLRDLRQRVENDLRQAKQHLKNIQGK